MSLEARREKVLRIWMFNVHKLQILMNNTDNRRGCKEFLEMLTTLSAHTDIMWNSYSQTIYNGSLDVDQTVFSLEQRVQLFGQSCYEARSYRTRSIILWEDSCGTKLSLGSCICATFVPLHCTYSTERFHYVGYLLTVLFDRTSVDVIPKKVVDSRRFCKSVLNLVGIQ